MLTVLLLASLVLTAQAANCCGDQAYNKEVEAYTECEKAKPSGGCEEGWEEKEGDANVCVTNDEVVDDCADTATTQNTMTCEQVQADIGDKCDEAGELGATAADDMTLLGCCAYVKRETPTCLCDEGLLDTYKAIKFTLDDGEEVESCGALEAAVSDTEEACSMALLFKDVTALACCVAKADADKTEDPVAKAKKDIKKGEDALYVTMTYSDADCKTLLYESSDSAKLDTCTQAEDDDGTKIPDTYYKVTVDEACSKVNMAYFTDEGCATAAKVTENGEEVDEVIVLEASDKCSAEKQKTAVYCEAVADSTTGSGVSMLSALVVLVTAAFYY